MIIQKDRVRGIFNDAGIEIKIEALNILDQAIRKDIKKMVRRARWARYKQVTKDNIRLII